MPAKEVIRELLVRFGVVTDDEAKLKAFDKRIESVKRNLEQAAEYADAAKTNIRALGTQIAVVAVGAAAGVTALTALTVQTTEYGTAVQRQAEMLGMSTDAYQELRGVMERFGVDQRDVADLFAQIAQQSTAAQGGAKNIVAAFESMGISVESLKGKDPEALFLAIADGAARTKDPTKRLSALSTLLGEDLTKKLGPLLGKGSAGIAQFREELRKTGAILDGDAIKASAEFQASLSETKGLVKGVTNEIAIAFLPAVKEVVTAVGRWIKGNRAMISQRLEQVIGGLARVLSTATRIAAVFARNIDTITMALGYAAQAATVLFLALAAFRAGSAAYNGIMAITFAVNALVVALGGAGAISAGFVGAIAAVIGAAFVVLAAELAAAAVQLYGVYVILEDIYTFFTNTGNSVLGDVVEKFRNADGAVGAWSRTLLTARATLGQVIVIVRALVQIAANRLQPAISAIGSAFLSLIAPAYEAFSTIGGFISTYVAYPLDRISKFLGGLQPTLAGLAGSLTATAAVGPTPSASAVLGGSRSSVTNNNQQASITNNITAPNAQAAGSAVTRSVVGVLGGSGYAHKAEFMGGDL